MEIWGGFCYSTMTYPILTNTHRAIAQEKFILLTLWERIDLTQLIFPTDGPLHLKFRKL